MYLKRILNICDWLRVKPVINGSIHVHSLGTCIHMSNSMTELFLI